MPGGTEIPAARPLQQVAAEGREVADLRARGLASGVGQGRVARHERGVPRDLGSSAPTRRAPPPCPRQCDRGPEFRADPLCARAATGPPSSGRGGRARRLQTIISALVADPTGEHGVGNRSCAPCSAASAADARIHPFEGMHHSAPARDAAERRPARRRASSAIGAAARRWRCRRRWRSQARWRCSRARRCRTRRSRSRPGSSPAECTSIGGASRGADDLVLLKVGVEHVTGVLVDMRSSNSA